MALPNNDTTILRELGQRVAEIAALPVQQETIRLWKALNGLRPARPMVLIDQIPWHEMDVDDELTLRSEDPFCQGLETRLRRTLYQWRHMPVDMVVEPWIEIPKKIDGAHFGIRAIERPGRPGPGKRCRRALLHRPAADRGRPREDPHARDPSGRRGHRPCRDRAHEIFDGILDVRMQGVHPGFAPWDRIVEWHGVEAALIDLVDRPDFMHKIMARVTEANLSLLDQLEAQGLLGQPQSLIHCTGAYTDELPAPGFDPQRPRSQGPVDVGHGADLRRRSLRRCTRSSRSTTPRRWYERFGLVYYGCCEPLDRKMTRSCRKIPNVRKISMSPWVERSSGAPSEIGGDFVFSRKPSPAFLAGDRFHPDAVRADLTETRDACARHGTRSSSSSRTSAPSATNRSASGSGRISL